MTAILRNRRRRRRFERPGTGVYLTSFVDGCGGRPFGAVTIVPSTQTGDWRPQSPARQARMIPERLPALAVHDPGRLDVERYSRLIRCVVGIDIDPQVILGQLVDHRIGGLFAVPGHPTPHLDPPERVLGIDHQHGCLGPLDQVLVLLPSHRRVDPDQAILDIASDRRHLRLAVWLNRRQPKEERAVEQVDMALGNRRHTGSPW